MGLGPKVFIRKNGFQKGGQLYKWSPGSDNRKKDKTAVKGNYFCVTVPGTQGNDYKTTYSYVIVVVNGQAERHAYAECDYVK
jgi:hypothetical protein